MNEHERRERAGAGCCNLWGEALFLDVPSSIFWGKGDLELGGPLAQSYGAKVKTFCAEISFEIILEI